MTFRTITSDFFSYYELIALVFLFLVLETESRLPHGVTGLGLPIGDLPSPPHEGDSHGFITNRARWSNTHPSFSSGFTDGYVFMFNVVTDR
jgi:hypothetical protein